MSDYQFWDELGNIFNAVLAYQQKTIEFNKRFVNPWIKLGPVFDPQEDNAKAVNACKQAIQIDPNNADNHLALGDVYFRMGQLDDAANAYSDAVELNPRAGWAYANLGLVYATNQQYDEAISLYMKSLDVITESNDRAMIWNRLGNAYRKINDYENACEAFQMADECDAGNTGFEDRLDAEPVEAPAPVGDGVAILPSEKPQDVELVAPEDVVDVPAEASFKQPEVAETEALAETVAEETAPSPEAVIDESVADVAVTMKESSATAVEPAVEEDVTATEELPVTEDVVLETVMESVASEVAASEETTEQSAPVLESAGEVTITPAPVFESEASATMVSLEQAEVVVAEPEVAAEPTETMETVAESEVAGEAVVEEQAPAEDAQPEVEVETAEAVEAVAEVETESLAEAESNPTVEMVAEVEAQSAPEDGPDSQSNETIIQEMVRLAGKNGNSESTPDFLEAEWDSEQKSSVADLMDDKNVWQIAPDTKNAHVWNELGNVYFDTGAYEEAIAAYAKAIELDSRFAWPYSNLALAYVHKERYSEAIQLYQRGIELFSSDKDKAITFNRLGNVYRRMNDYDNAIASYQRADDLDPNNATRSLRSRFSLLGSLSMETSPNLAL